MSYHDAKTIQGKNSLTVNSALLCLHCMVKRKPTWSESTELLMKLVKPLQKNKDFLKWVHVLITRRLLTQISWKNNICITHLLKKLDNLIAGGPDVKNDC